MHGRLALALLALSLLLPASANAAVEAGKDIRKVEGYTASAGALVRVTLREKLSGRIGVSFRTRGGVRGSASPSATIRRGRRVDFLFRGDARNLGRAIVRTGPRGERVSRRLRRVTDDCAALTRLARKLRPLRRGRPAVRARLRAITRRRSICGGTTVPVERAPAPAPAPGPGFTPPAARFSLADGLTPEDPLSAAAAITFSDASQGSELVDWRWDFGDGATATGPSVQHAFAQPGRFTVLLTVRNARGQSSAFGQEVFVRAGGTATFAGPVADCPAPGATTTVTITRVVPSWARAPLQVGYSIPAGCGADVSSARALAITPGNAGGEKDAWGREAATLSFEFDLTDGDPGGADVTPEVTASWG